MFQRISLLSPNACQSLLIRYFDRVVELRCAEKSSLIAQERVRLQLDEQKQTIYNLERALRHQVGIRAWQFAI
ncbi:unnamed protein product [Protopolystoma xenopodis]|uniref:Uncharacterized protein n=1 Tax=Protopolystoma xenopodis TaxID=117903 RepID=A0A3S4ZYD1_9PLAT|nr:unnamed protein product [Protopolystoma xenopodis]